MALKHESTHVSISVGDLYQQEVLDNLARFVDNYNAFPSFAYATQGAATITDEGSFGAGATLTHSSEATLSLMGSRTIADSYTLNPVNDPRKLELMRCAFQRAVSSCGYGPVESQTCPDCEATFNKFYTGDPTTKVADSLVGEVTSECLKAAPPWFCTGPKKCVPKGCCIPVGHNCNTYVWVPPEGREYLSRLTIAIMDYAINSAPAPLTKQVTYYLDENGVPTTQKLAVGQVSAGVPVTEDPISLLNTPNQTEIQLDMELQQRMRRDQAAIKALQDEAKNNGGKLTEADKITYRRLTREVESLSGKLDYLQHQLKTGGLKNKYYRPAPAPEAGAGLLPLKQILSTVPGP
ncbi:MAG TPA: hypothetical protein VEI07_23025 [Planctomycetaceae bacterium]|nr:hypothetical protein [Planctomycetaceae bacterium]